MIELKIESEQTGIVERIQNRVTHLDTMFGERILSRVAGTRDEMTGSSSDGRIY
jgi:hypothetical protein